MIMEEVKTVNQIQDEFIENFNLFEEDMESRIFYLMDLGHKLPAFNEEHLRDEFLVKGCQSKVWLYPEIKENRIWFEADSNTEITKGLIYLLITLWNGRKPTEILHTELYFIEKIGMNRMIGSQRSNGFSSMIRQMQLFAATHKNEE